VCGVHYRSDVEASKKWAVAMVKIMKSNPQFQEELARATAELRLVLGLE
jgi:acid phosphatase (class A)